VESLSVKELMVPLSRYAAVSEDATLGEAVIALKKAQKDFDQTRDLHRAILISDKNNNIVGKLSQLDVIRALEPKYVKFDDGRELSRFGLTRDYMKAILEEHQLWEKSLDNICEKAAKLIVKNIMYTPTEGEYVMEDATLEEAIHQLIMGRHQSLLVTRSKTIVGVLRLTDVFREIANRISSCPP
jgi:CBS domain containing-hemolysin-like protein